MLLHSYDWNGHVVRLDCAKFAPASRVNFLVIDVVRGVSTSFERFRFRLRMVIYRKVRKGVYIQIR